MSNLDFTGAPAPQTFPVVVMSPTLARATATTTLYANGTTALLARNSTLPLSGAALAAAQAAAGDVYDQAIALNAATSSEAASIAIAAPAMQTLAAPPPLGTATSMDATGTTYPEIMTTWTAYGSAIGYAWTGTQQLATAQCGTGATTPCTIAWAAVLSQGVVGATPAYQMPDLSPVAGWTAAFQMVTGQQTNESLTAVTSSAGASDWPPVTPPAVGTSRTSAQTRWMFMP